MLPDFPLLSLFYDPDDCVQALESFLCSIIAQGEKELLEDEKREEKKTETEDKKDTTKKRGHERKKSRKTNSILTRNLSQITQIVLDSTEALMGLVIIRGSTLGILSTVSILMDCQSKSYRYQRVYPYLKRLANWKLDLQLSCLTTHYSGAWSVVWSDANPLSHSSGEQTASIATDGSYIYIHCLCGLLKVGSGNNGTIRGRVYLQNDSWFPKERSNLICIEDKLFFRSPCTTPAALIVLNCSNFSVSISFYFNTFYL